MTAWWRSMRTARAAREAEEIAREKVERAIVITLFDGTTRTMVYRGHWDLEWDRWVSAGAVATASAERIARGGFWDGEAYIAPAFVRIVSLRRDGAEP